MTRTATILRNIASNWAGFAVSAVVTLVLTPIVLRGLGEARYGVWVLTASITGYYGLLDLGFRGGVNQYLTRYLSVGDDRKASECMSSALAVLVAIGSVISVLTVILAYLAPRVVNLPEGMEREAFWTIVIVGLSSALQVVFFPFAAVFTATQRFDLANLIGVVTRLLTAAGVYAALTMGYGLVGISAVTCGANLVDYLIRWRVAYRLAPRLHVSPRLANRARIREIGSFGGWSFLISLSVYLYGHAQMLLIGWLMPVAAVGYYALAVALAGQIRSVLTPIGQAINPSAVELHARGDRGMLERLYHEGSRLMLLATISVVLPAAFWAEDFYRVWIGETYLRDSTFASVALLLRIMIVGIMAGYAANIAGQILLGAGHVRAVAIAHVVGGVLSLALSLAAIRPYGLVGVAASAVIGAVSVELIAIPLLLQRAVGLRVKAVVKSACLRPAAVGVLLAGCMASMRLAAGRPADWFHLVLYGVLTAIAAAAIVLLAGVSSEERQRLIGRPVRQLLGRATPAAANAQR
jgi:O-antigen/teichoic acid export membrane protein